MDRAMRNALWSMVLFAATGFAGSAGATMTEVLGGPGGGSFALNCGAGRYLVGFHARTGGWVDGIGLVCAPYDAATQKLGAGRRTGYTGGRGGAEQEVYCGPGNALTGIALVHTRGNGLKRQYVNTVAIRCRGEGAPKRCIASGEGCRAILERESVGIVGSNPRPYDVLTCPSPEFATGIQGRSGIYVDAIGLICAPPPPTPQSPPSTAAEDRRKILLKHMGRRDAERIDYGGAPKPPQGTLVK